MAVTIQLRRDTAANWTSVNPILAEGELGFETDTLLYKLGDGVTAWNSLAYTALRLIDEATVIDMSNQAIPATPLSDHLNLFAKHIAGRMLLRQQGPSGLSTPLQPSFFQNQILVVGPNTSTTMTSIGGNVAYIGGVTHPAVSEAYGYCTNIASTTANTGGGVSDTNVRWYVGSVANSANGFFFGTRAGFPDATYDNTGASTGSRIFVGFTDQTLLATLQSDNAAGNRCGFSRCHVNGGLTDTNFFLTTKNGTTETRVDTGMAFTVQCVYDFWLFVPPYPNTILYWRIDNLTLNTSVEGSTLDTLPLGNVALRGGAGVGTVQSLARNIRVNRMYIESDR